MKNDRRLFLLGCGALALGACASAPVRNSSGPPRQSNVPGDLRPTPNAAYEAWVAQFKTRALAQGISAQTLTLAFQDAGYLPGAVKRDRNQVEFSRTFEDYLSIAASDERIRKGRAAFAKHQATLNAVEARYGVAPEIVTAIWGLESSYGERRGDISVISATSTLAFDGRRGTFFEKQLIEALKILQSGDVSAANLKGSWAGAMGHTQFIPTSYAAFAVDFDGDGRRDIWSEDPTDSLASTAAYLARNGWTAGVKWGGEIGDNAPAGTQIQPQPGGPRFSVTSNFNALKRYNNSDSYALSVGHLSDRIAGAGPLKGSFPPDQYGLTKAERQLLQRRLTQRGFNTDGADGVIGPKSRDAIKEYQRSIGVPATGDPSQSLLQSLV
ncbi:MAG: lytic murein transglycosylase [Pseudomonadota bacterium]